MTQEDLYKKAVLSNRIFLSKTDELLENLREKLRYRLPNYRRDLPPITYYDVTRINDNILSIPIGRTDLIPRTYKIIDKRVLVPYEFPNNKIILREEQQEVFDKVNDSCIINAKPNWGKTFVALSIAKKLGQKTLVITHTLGIREQWIAAAERIFGINAGIIGSGQYMSDSLVVVSNVQTLSKVVDQYTKEFGTLLIDECLDYDCRLDTLEYGEKRIGIIVNQKLPCHVKSFNIHTKQFEYKKVLRYFKNPQNDLMIKFKFGHANSLTCTLNHSLYKYNNGLIEKTIAEHILENDYLIIEKTHKTNYLLTSEIKPIILGIILGDGSLSINDSGNAVRVSVTNGQNQLNYLQYKRKLLSTLVKTEEKESSSGYKPNNEVYQFSTLSFIDIENWRNIIYNNSRTKNCLTEEIVDTLDINSWSILYQDDGAINNDRYISFSFCEFSTDSIQLLQKSLERLFSITDSYIYTCNKGFNYLKIKKEGSKVFIEAIEHLIHPELAYKKGIYNTNKPFTGIVIRPCIENFSILKVKEVSFVPATNGYRYNIEVEDNHNYLANNKLVGNCHHIPANTFKNIIDKSKARYKIGLSGTLERKDGKHIYLPDYISKNIIVPKDTNKLVPKVIVIETDIPFRAGPMIPWATSINNLTSREDYKNLIINLAKAQAEIGHKVLVVSDRTDFLIYCSEQLENSIYIIGKTKDREEQQELLKKEKDILFAAISMYKEGINMPDLSCLILGTPTNNSPMLEQLIGRIIRDSEGKRVPVIIDIVLKGTTAKNQFNTRLGYYSAKGYEINYL